MALLLDIPFTPFDSPDVMEKWLVRTKQLLEDRKDELLPLEKQAAESMRDVVAKWYRERTGREPDGI